MRVKVLDFGIAKVTSGELDSGEKKRPITRTGSFVGSPLYMSPEQTRGKGMVDHRSDLWSLGIVLYQMIAGRTPFDHLESLGDFIVAVRTTPVDPIRVHAPWVDPMIARAIEHALVIDPAQRYQSADEMRAALATFLPQGASITPAMLVPTRPSGSPPQGTVLGAGTAMAATTPGAVGAPPQRDARGDRALHVVRAGARLPRDDLAPQRPGDACAHVAIAGVSHVARAGRRGQARGRAGGRPHALAPLGVPRHPAVAPATAAGFERVRGRPDGPRGRGPRGGHGRRRRHDRVLLVVPAQQGKGEGARGAGHGTVPHGADRPCPRPRPDRCRRGTAPAARARGAHRRLEERQRRPVRRGRQRRRHPLPHPRRDDPGRARLRGRGRPVPPARPPGLHGHLPGRGPHAAAAARRDLVRPHARAQELHGHLDRGGRRAAPRGARGRPAARSSS